MSGNQQQQQNGQQQNQKQQQQQKGGNQSNGITMHRGFDATNMNLKDTVISSVSEAGGFACAAVGCFILKTAITKLWNGIFGGGDTAPQQPPVRAGQAAYLLSQASPEELDKLIQKNPALMASVERIAESKTVDVKAEPTPITVPADKPAEAKPVATK